MLVLSRKVGEWIIFRNRDTGETIGAVCVNDLWPNAARMGFDFPPNIEIVRSELVSPDPVTQTQLAKAG